MAVSRAYTYLGKTSEGYQVVEGVYSFLSADTYLRATQITLTFATMARVIGILGITGFVDAANNLGNPIVLVSIATNVVTVMMLETGAGAGVGLNEKTNAEAYGADGSIRVTAYGL